MAKKKKLPLCSSGQVIGALQRLDFKPRKGSKKSKGTHRSYVRTNPDGSKDTTVVILGKKQIPRGTLKSILALGRITQEQFEAVL